MLSRIQEGISVAVRRGRNAREAMREGVSSYDLGFNDTALPTIDVANNRVYLVAPSFGPEDGALYALNKETGEIAWYKSKVVGNLSAKGDYVLLKEDKIFGLADVDWFDYQMYRLNVTTQNIDFFFDVPTPLPDADDDKILQYSLCGNQLIVGIGVNDDNITDVDKGSVVIYSIDSPVVVRRIDFPYLITGQIACNTTTNTLYIPTNPYLYALNAQTGQEVWSYMGYGSIYTPSIANGIVYFISDTNMYAVDEETGQRLFFYPLGYDGEESSQVAIDDGMIYFSGNGGTCDLFALGGESEEVCGGADEVIDYGILMGENVICTASSSIRMTSGFFVEEDAIFRARILD